MASTRKSPPSSPLLKHVGAVLERHVRRGDRLTLGYSGGVDSSVLLDLLRRLSARLGFELSALHVDHAISPSSARWAEFCAQACAAHAIPLTVERVSLRRGNSLEAAARSARYRAYAAQAADFVVLAHNLDDQAETLLLQLLRGAGAKGLSAMPEVRGEETGERGKEKGERGREQGDFVASHLSPLGSRILRPLLEIPRSEIESYARRRRLRWIEDDSNADTGFDRNFVRHEVLPVIAQRYPSYRATLARSSRNLAEAAHLLDELGAADAPLTGTGIAIGGLQRLSEARAKNALRHFLALHGVVMPNAARLDEYVRQVRHGKRGTRTALDLGNHRLLRFGDELRLVAEVDRPPCAYSCLWHGESSLVLDELGGTLRMTRRRGAGISLARLTAGPVSVRLRQGGERFQPDLRRPRRSLKNLLQEARVPPWVRDRLPLLYSGATLVYVPGIGIDPGYLAADQELGVEPSWDGVPPAVGTGPGR